MQVKDVYYKYDQVHTNTTGKESGAGTSMGNWARGEWQMNKMPVNPEVRRR